MAPSSLPDNPDFEGLGDEAKHRLESIDEQLTAAARRGDADRLRALLDEFPERPGRRFPPYNMTLLHLAANSLPCVELLLARGLDPNAKEDGDRTYAMHWAAAAGNLEVVRRLADAGGDVIGAGDDHELGIIGWATCWDGAQTPAHRAVADFLVSRGARHHVFSAIALDDEALLHRVAAEQPSALNRRMSRNENHQTALQFAVRTGRPRMVEVLLELGADPLGTDGDGMPVAVYAVSPGADGPVMERIRDLTLAELDSAERGHRAPRLAMLDLAAALTLHDTALADRLVRLEAGLARIPGLVHILAKRGDLDGLRWLLDRGADPNERWPHWNAVVTPLHLAILGDHIDALRLLLERGADPKIRDSMHDGDALDWADHFERAEMSALLRTRY